jgi:hypothetical protein
MNAVHGLAVALKSSAVKNAGKKGARVRGCLDGTNTLDLVGVRGGSMPDEGPAQRFVYNNLSITFFVEDINFNRLVGDQSSGNSHINLVC